MTLAGRIKRLEAQRAGAGPPVGSVALVYDATGELTGAQVTRWDGMAERLERWAGETAATFQLRVGMMAGDLASAQAYVMGRLKRVQGEV